jgi:hypothetical protein
MFCPRKKSGSAGVAGTMNPRISKRSLTGRISGPVAGTTARRKLTKPGRNQPQSEAPSADHRDLVRKGGTS